MLDCMHRPWAAPGHRSAAPRGRGSPTFPPDSEGATRACAADGPFLENAGRPCREVLFTAAQGRPLSAGAREQDSRLCQLPGLCLEEPTRPGARSLLSQKPRPRKTL